MGMPDSIGFHPQVNESPKHMIRLVTLLLLPSMPIINKPQLEEKTRKFMPLNRRCPPFDSISHGIEPL